MQWKQFKNHKDPKLNGEWPLEIQEPHEIICKTLCRPLCRVLWFYQSLREIYYPKWFLHSVYTN